MWQECAGIVALAFRLLGILPRSINRAKSGREPKIFVNAVTTENF